MFQVGTEIIWDHVPRGGWGYSFAVPGVVIKVGPKRVQIEVKLTTGKSAVRWVRPEHLRARQGA